MRNYQVGDVFENKYGKCTIVELLPNNRCLIKWDDYDSLCNVTRWNLSKGAVKPKETQQRKKSLYTGKETIYPTKIHGKETDLFGIWRSMRKRCGKRINYMDCVVCKEWMYDYQSFAEWATPKYIEGWELDKDILFKGNKIYSPLTCCFVPQHINSIFTKNEKNRGLYPIGVYYAKKDKLYQARVSEYGHWVYLGCYKDPINAFNAYKIEKERYIKEVANKYKDKLEPRVYDALMKYKVEITD